MALSLMAAILMPGAAARADATAGRIPATVAAWTIVEGGGYTPLTNQERWRLYVRQTFASPALPAGSAFRALLRQARDEPPEWGQGTAGYSRRFGDRLARAVLRESYEAAGAAVLGLEPRYVRCSCTGVLARTAYAVGMNFVTYDRNRRLVPNVSHMGAILASQYTGNLWMPQGYRTPGNVARDAGFQLGFSALTNIVREFSPEWKRLLKRK
jgi:hypothetical protein